MASLVSHLTSAAVFVDAIALIQSECKAMMNVMDKMEGKIPEIDGETMTGG